MTPTPMHPEWFLPRIRESWLAVQDMHGANHGLAPHAVIEDEAGHPHMIALESLFDSGVPHGEAYHCIRTLAGKLRAQAAIFVTEIWSVRGAAREDFAADLSQDPRREHGITVIFERRGAPARIWLAAISRTEGKNTLGPWESIGDAAKVSGAATRLLPAEGEHPENDLAWSFVVTPLRHPRGPA